MSVVRTWARKPITWIVAAVVLVGAVVGLALFQPWKIVVDETVDEAAPVAAPSTMAPESPAPSQSPATSAVLATGNFISHEHETTGKVVVLRLPTGERVLRLENLNTSNGPDLHVWITDAPVKTGTAGWKVFDDGKYVALGKLKGNRGSQNYALPASVDLGQLSSVSIWCDRFNVSFGAAALAVT
jgi:hypothetical protein